MWFSSCCLLNAMVLTIVAFGIDLLLTIHGQSYRLGDEITADTIFGYNDIRMTVVYQWEEDVVANRTTILSYDEVYADLCGEKNARNQDIDSSYCSELNALKDAGSVYFAIAVLALVMIVVAFFMAFVLTIARCICKRPMKLGVYCVVGLTIVSFVALIAAMFVLRNDFAPNATDVLGEIYVYYYPVAQFDTQWDGSQIGASWVCFYVACAIQIISILSLLFLEKTHSVGCRNSRPRGHPHHGESPPLLEIEGQGPRVENSTINPESGMGAAAASYRV